MRDVPNLEGLHDVEWVRLPAELAVPDAEQESGGEPLAVRRRTAGPSLQSVGSPRVDAGGVPHRGERPGQRGYPGPDSGPFLGCIHIPPRDSASVGVLNHPLRVRPLLSLAGFMVNDNGFYRSPSRTKNQGQVLLSS